MYGELRRVMHEGQTGPAVTLSSLLKPTLYALGALSELRGEVTVLAGNVWLSYPAEGDTVRVEELPSSDERAALLVTANVDAWTEIRLPKDVLWAQLEQQIETLAAAAGVDVERPFPFLLEGKFSELRWHVIDGKRLAPGPSSHELHKQLAVKGSATDCKATLLGFFSKRHHGVFTHRGENAHLHFVDAQQRRTGHVDLANVQAETVLKVPQ